ncbi:hypothetical protein DL89DRAFT_270577 [Linderina pennispora]|uniref:Uncharacterized protein n=1 Tax=Linderina pennispora TaxID=61395 RepID=A0A1Y1VYH1_9FUNG|nr:uncharacterized protein DL89DRAFT_270577 [Linderina pennispora]ORX65864.1 hypothetical protein DL89DRAFT_270577 [Linderina pennispora]
MAPLAIASWIHPVAISGQPMHVGRKPARHVAQILAHRTHAWRQQGAVSIFGKMEYVDCKDAHHSRLI